MCNFNLSILLVQFFLAPPERCTLPRWYSSNYPKMYEALVKLVSRFPPNLHLLPIYTTDFTMFEAGESLSVSLFFDFISSRVLFEFLVMSYEYVFQEGFLRVLFLFPIRWEAFQGRLRKGHGRRTHDQL